MAKTADTTDTALDTPKKPGRKPRSPKAETSAAPKPRKAKAKAEAAPAAATAASNGKARFAAAIEQAKAGAATLREEAKARSEGYSKKYAGKQAELLEEAQARTAEAKQRAAELAAEGKTRTTGAMTNLSKLVEANASKIDETMGAQYGDYARTAARHIQETATKLDAKDLGELGGDAREFVRASPGLAVGIAAVAGFMLARLFSSSED